MAVRVAFLLWGAVLGGISIHVTRSGPGYSFTAGTLTGEVLLLGAGWALTLAATVTAGRHDRRAVARLLLLASTAWFVASWANLAASDLAFTVGTVGYVATPAIVFHVVTIPVGLRSPRLITALVVSGYLVMLGIVGLASALTFHPATLGCSACPANLLNVWQDPHIWSRLSEIGLQAGTVWTAAAIVTVAWWLLCASAVQRRDFGLLAVAALAYLALELGYFARGWSSGMLRSGAIDRTLWQFQAGALCTLAAAAVADLIRIRRAERALTRVVSDLGAKKDLRAQIATLTGDPALLIAYPSDNNLGHVDAEGRPVDPTSKPGRVTEVRRSGTLLATVVHRPDVAADRVRELSAAVHLALDHERLRANALTQLNDIRRSGVRLVAAGDAERRRLEHNLHDGAQQTLVALLIGLRMLNGRAETIPELLEAEELLESAITQLRDLAHRLHPVLLERAGLATALQGLTETRPLELLALPQRRLAPLIEATLYLLVEHVSRDQPASVHVNAGPEAVALRITVAGELPDLSAISDRISALDGAITCSGLANASVVTLMLPLDRTYEPNHHAEPAEGRRPQIDREPI